MFGRKKKVKEKFCPQCGAKLKIEDAYCVRCGYSFSQRQKETKKKNIKWRNIIIALIIALLVYIGVNYSNNQPIIPSFIKNLFQFSKG